MDGTKWMQDNLREKDLGTYLALELVAEISYQRQGKGMSQTELGKLAGVSQKTVSRIENGVYIPTLDTLGRLLNALGCKPRIIFED